MQGRFLIKIITATLSVMILIGYAYYQTKNLALGPQIEITTPKNGSSLQEKLIVLEGVTKNISKISINDFPIYVDQKGAFKEKLLLAQGYNLIELSASDRFDREINKKLEIVYLKK